MPTRKVDFLGLRLPVPRDIEATNGATYKEDVMSVTSAAVLLSAPCVD